MDDITESTQTLRPLIINVHREIGDVCRLTLAALGSICGISLSSNPRASRQYVKNNYLEELFRFVQMSKMAESSTTPKPSSFELSYYDCFMNSVHTEILMHMGKDDAGTFEYDDYAKLDRNMPPSSSSSSQATNVQPNMNIIVPTTAASVKNESKESHPIEGVDNSRPWKKTKREE